MISLTYLNSSLWFLNIHDAMPLFTHEVDCLSGSVLADSHSISKIKKGTENNQLAEELELRQCVLD